MSIRKIILLFFLLALTSISVGSVALGGPDEGRVAKPLADHKTFTLECYSYNDNFQAAVWFWWTRDGKFHGNEDDWEEGFLECWGDSYDGFSSDSDSDFDTPETVINDFHKKIVLTDHTTGQQTICLADYKFQTDTTPDSQGLEPDWFHQSCALPGLIENGLPFQGAIFDGDVD